MNLKKALAGLVWTTLCASSFDPTIPVLDLDDYYDSSRHEKFLSELRSALHDYGFFALIHAGVDPETLDAGYAASFDFFALPLDEKLSIYNPAINGQRGYVPGETAKGMGAKDFKEFLHVGRELSDEKLLALNFEKNLWPKSMDLQTPVVNLYNALEKCRLPIASAMAEALGMESELFHEMTAEGNSLMRAIHYPANPPEGTIWAGEHTDIDLFTILPRATSEGLEVMGPDGKWISVITPEGAFIVNGGDMLENITNGEFKAGLHRVRAAKDGYERYSIVYFVHPRSEEPLDPLPICVLRANGQKHYPNATRLELLEERLIDLGLASRQAMEHFAKSGVAEQLIDLGRASEGALKRLADEGLASEKVLDFLAKEPS